MKKIQKIIMFCFIWIASISESTSASTSSTLKLTGTLIDNKQYELEVIEHYQTLPLDDDTNYYKKIKNQKNFKILTSKTILY